MTSHTARWTSDAIGAIVIGGDYRGLGAVRSLGRHGVPVWVMRDEHALAATSRYAVGSSSWPAAGDAEQVDSLLDLARRQGLDGWMLLPTGDETAALVARHQDALERRFRIPSSPWNVLQWAYDKRLTYRLAECLGLNVPWTHYPSSPDDVATLECHYPVILKPAIKEAANSFTTAKAWRVDNRADLLARYDQARTLVPPDTIMIQELVPGGGEAQRSFAALCVDGVPVVSVTARRARQFPLDFGRASTFVESIDDPESESIARALLHELRYTGLIEVELKHDSRDRRLKVLDLNPRMWGWHTIGRKAGGDFCYQLWRLAVGKPVAPARVPEGRRWLRVSMDVPAAAREILSGRLTPWAYLSSLRGPMEPAVWAGDDPLPGLLDVPLMLSLARSRRSAQPATLQPAVS
jgi:predicted ATP-grasp superfamily ATP-dependent carboligase